MDSDSSERTFTGGGSNSCGCKGDCIRCKTLGGEVVCDISKIIPSNIIVRIGNSSMIIQGQHFNQTS